jgi:hypothetical protein
MGGGSESTERVGPEPCSNFCTFSLKTQFSKHGVTFGVTVFAVLIQRTIFPKCIDDFFMPQDDSAILLIA